MATFIAQELSLQRVRELSPIAQRVAKHDRDLARQLRRAASSIVLNLAEGRIDRRVRGPNRQSLATMAYRLCRQSVSSGRCCEEGLRFGEWKAP